MKNNNEGDNFSAIFFLNGCASNPPNSLTAQQIENICQKKKNEAAKPTTNNAKDQHKAPTVTSLTKGMLIKKS